MANKTREKSRYNQKTVKGSSQWVKIQNMLVRWRGTNDKECVCVCACVRIYMNIFMLQCSVTFFLQRAEYIISRSKFSKKFCVHN